MASKKKQDIDLAKEYLAKLEITKRANEVNPFETKSEKDERIARAKRDVVFMVKTYLPHYATAECAPFHWIAANQIANDILIKIFMEWFRGGAKSVWADVIIPLWLWMRGEEIFLCLLSDSSERASELLADIQAELEGNPLLINDFGAQKCEGDWTVGN
ncbi:MAG: hypothetical protein WCG93_15620, partial [Paludibacter sp.]